VEKKFIGLGVAAGCVGGIASFAVARTQVTPLIAAAIDYEDGRSAAEAALSGEREHGHEVFSRALQANVGAGVATVVFGIVLGALFAVAFSVLWARLRRRHPAVSPRTLATALAGAGFVVLYLVPFLGYPANPPGVGDAATIGGRTSAYLILVVLSVGLAITAYAAAGRLLPKFGGFTTAVLGAAGYVLAISLVLLAMPTYAETPGPLADSRGAELYPGFPAEVLADFRLYSVLASAVMWTVIGATFAAFVPRVLANRPSTAGLATVATT
jgi:Probable cobalt transporter subunit (CbtA)